MILFFRVLQFYFSYVMYILGYLENNNAFKICKFESKEKSWLNSKTIKFRFNLISVPLRCALLLAYITFNQLKNKDSWVSRLPLPVCIFHKKKTEIQQTMKNVCAICSGAISVHHKCQKWFNKFFKKVWLIFLISVSLVDQPHWIIIFWKYLLK